MTLKQHIAQSDGVLNRIPNGIIIIDLADRIMFINQRVRGELNIIGSLSENDILALNFTELLLLKEEDKDIFKQLKEEVLKTGKDVMLPKGAFILNKITNNIFPISGCLSPLFYDDNLEGYIFYFRNITNELTREYILNTALVRTKIYTWFLDIENGVFVLDPRYFDYLGIPKGPGNTLTMEQYTNLVHPDDRQKLADAFEIQFSGEDIYEDPVPFQILRGDGRWEWFEGQSTYIGKLSGLPYRLVGICTSIQAHKDTEAILINARKKAEESDKLKSAFIANMSHEIRTPLNAIVGFSNVLSSAYEELSQEERDEFIRLINSNNEHLLVLINDILDLSRIKSGAMQYTFSKESINGLMADIFQCQSLNFSSDIDLKLELPSEEVSIITDAMRFKQVINNLINNARKFTTKGYVKFGIKSHDTDSVVIFVQDTGEGMKREDVEHIFERFYKVDSFKPGTGLGLPICETIINRFMGHIDVISEVGKGSCFEITLPLNACKILD